MSMIKSNEGTPYTERRDIAREYGEKRIAKSQPKLPFISPYSRISNVVADRLNEHLLDVWRNGSEEVAYKDLLELVNSTESRDFQKVPGLGRCMFTDKEIHILIMLAERTSSDQSLGNTDIEEHLEKLDAAGFSTTGHRLYELTECVITHCDLERLRLFGMVSRSDFVTRTWGELDKPSFFLNLTDFGRNLMRQVYDELPKTEAAWSGLT